MIRQIRNMFVLNPLNIIYYEKYLWALSHKQIYPFVKYQFFCEIISWERGEGGGVCLTDFIPLLVFVQNAPFFTPKNKYFTKWDGGRGGGHPFMKWFHEKSVIIRTMASLSEEKIMLLIQTRLITILCKWYPLHLQILMP